MPIRLTRAIKALLFANIGAFVLQNALDRFAQTDLASLFALVPSGMIVEHRFWQLFTYSFLHADVTHLLLNMLMLVFVGAELEQIWGSVKFITYYTFCALFAGATYLLMQLVILKGIGLHAPMMGASGAIYGLLVAYGILFGERVMLFMMLFPMKAKHFVWILAAVEFFTVLFSPRGGLSAVAHLAGMLGGFLYLMARTYWLIFQRQRSQPRKSRKAEHLKLVINNVRGLSQNGEKDPNDRGSDPKTWH